MFSTEIPKEDLRLTLAAMQYGQVITHDLSHIAGNYAQSRIQLRSRFVIRIS